MTDAVFSMDGDIAPLEEICELAHRYGARVMVDEAHAMGAIGPGGRGAVAEAGLQDEVDVIVGTLGKALGSYGAYVCCDETMTSYLVNTARTLIFSTALPPPAVAGALAALELVREQPRRVERLAANAAVDARRAGRPGPGHRALVSRRSCRWWRAMRVLRCACARRRWRGVCSRRRSGRPPCPRAPRACAWR